MTAVCTEQIKTNPEMGMRCQSWRTLIGLWGSGFWVSFKSVWLPMVVDQLLVFTAWLRGCQWSRPSQRWRMRNGSRAHSIAKRLTVLLEIQLFFLNKHSLDCSNLWVNFQHYVGRSIFFRGPHSAILDMFPTIVYFIYTTFMYLCFIVLIPQYSFHLLFVVTSIMSTCLLLQIMLA